MEPVAVVVPARDEAASLGKLLEALSNQVRPPEAVVVCDAGSTDATVSVAREWRARDVDVVTAGPSYPGRARNVGARATTQPWVAFVDCGCEPDAQWLAELVAARDAGVDVDVVYGDYDPFVNGEWDAAQALVILSPRSRTTGCRPPSTASMLIRRELFLRLGGFPEHLRAAEDLWFFEAIERARARVVHAPKARVRWALAPSPGAVFRRLRLYSRHHVAAGLSRTWHHRVLAMDAGALALAVAGVAWPPAWALLMACAIARVARTVLLRRSSVPPEARELTPGRLARVAALLAIADVACVLGYLDHVRGRVARSPR